MLHDFVQRSAQPVGFRCGDRTVALHRPDPPPDLVDIVRLFEQFVEQHTVVAGREPVVRYSLFDVASGAEADRQPVCGIGGPVSGERGRWDRFRFRGARGSTEQDGESLRVFDDFSAEFADAGLAVAPRNNAVQERADAFALGAAGGGQHDVELLPGPRQGHVEEIQVVYVGHDVFPIIVGGEVGVGHRFFVVHGELSYGGCGGVLLRARPHDGVGLGGEGPVAVGDDDRLVAESFGAVDGVDGDGVPARGHGDGSGASAFHPPCKEEGDVGYVGFGERDDLLVEGLQVGDLFVGAAQAIPHHRILEGLLGWHQP